ncbi:hypothetical protein F5B22DRAFT_635445 [Xylaria bambusicola]|uniref:uncharacterized protein n=1 Tax=Xylaria bambusicola TaxID=326684 RepID=UPI00200897D8|nr:uncharacterized protein F5B22DRAFT_635445 [Xylaria bambusicola]KAI0517926.1 hypothetical protein F5B22DRAFT_635445 [Xylaria bambusicola]
MPRKGNVKVRTGCLTCKIRKVKCDEEKPSCRRCTSTKRKCDGYAPVSPSSAVSWYRPRHLFPNVHDSSERRSLQFFVEVAAPVLSGPLDPYFWTHLVLQFSQMEPAVRHSVVALASLYEQVDSHRDSTTPLPDDNLVLLHYNSAIQHLKTMKNESLVLLVCVLFVCIEFLRGNRAGATLHSQHGVSILKRVEETYPWAREHLSPIFRRLSVLPFFFRNPEDSGPVLLCLDDAIPSFSSFSDAQFYLDGILGRTIRLIRRCDVYRLGHMRHKDAPPSILAEQDLTRTLLETWHSNFVQLEHKSPESGLAHIHRCNMLMKYHLYCVWTENCFETDETSYDRWLDTFRAMVVLLTTVEPSDSRTVKFTFEMGFIPLLYFVTMKCRCLETRLRALSLMKQLSAVKESLWELVAMFASAKRLIEIEHGAILTDDGCLSGEPSCPGLPPDEMRVRDISTGPYSVVQTINGAEVVGRPGGFFMRTVEGRIYVRSEFLPQPSWIPETPQAISTLAAFGTRQ